MKTVFFLKKKVVSTFLAIVFLTSFGCSKKDNPTDSNIFKVADFKLTIISHGQGAGNSHYNVEYTVQNISNKNYDDNSNDNFIFKFTVKDNSGNTYTETRYLLPLIESGTSKSGSAVIDLPSGSVAIPSTFKAVIEMY